MNSNLKKILGIAVLLIVGSVAAFAQADTLALSGTMGNVLSIVVTEVGNYNNLDLLNGEVNESVATVTVTSNRPWDLSIGSANWVASTARLARGGVEWVPYTIRWATAAVNFTSATVSVLDESVATDFDGNDYAVDLSLTAINPTPGTYTDTLTFTVSVD